MSKELNQTGRSRRSFLVKLGLGVTALASVSTGLVGLTKKAKQQEFPGPDSIFHPAQDPRTDSRRR